MADRVGGGPVDLRHVSERTRRMFDQELGDATGFLPPRVPLDDLPFTLVRFLDACAELPDRHPAERGGVRGWLDREFRVDDPAVRRAVTQLSRPEEDVLGVALCALAHTYRWDTVPPAPERFAEQRINLPPGILSPWRNLTRRTGQPLAGTAWTLHLNNWNMVDRAGGATYQADELTPERLRITHSWLRLPAHADLENFSVAFVLVEAKGRDVVRALVDAVEGVAIADIGATHAALRRARAAIAAMTLTFSMNVRKRTVDPATWLQVVQPTFGWRAEGDRPGQIEGGPSGMQLGSVQALDAVLGIGGHSAVAQLARSGRRAMPRSHRRFLGVLDLAGPLLRTFVAKAGCTELVSEFDACVQAVLSFRATHRARGALYLRHRPPGDGARASTGLVLAIDADPAVVFEQSMTARMCETKAAMLADGVRRRAVTVV